MFSSGIVAYDISDHLGTYISISLQNNTKLIYNDGDDNCSTYSNVNAENLVTFQNLLKNETWTDVLEETDTQKKYDKFIVKYTTLYETAFPKKSAPKRKRQRKNPKPWILPWLEEACERKNRLYHTYVKNPSIENKTKYAKMKKFVLKHIRLAKNKFYKNYFEKYKSDSRKQWQMLNNLLNRSKFRSNAIKLKDEHGSVINESKAIADKFNDYFVNIAHKLKREIGNDVSGTSDRARQHDYTSHLRNATTDSIYLAPSTPYEVGKIIDTLKLKATSDQNIGALKAASTIPGINEVLSNIINSSFEQGVFPSQLKIAKVVPIHKSGPKNDVANYRPISLLPAFSKIFEKLMHQRVYNFLEINSSLNDLQFGFRSGRSCEHALLVAQNEILASLSKKQISLLLLIDFSKAFDMVNHNILLDKLEHYGIRGIANTWFKSYLSNRQQYVSIKGKASSKQSLQYSVPQGSILGPLLFVIYINDMPNITNIAKFVLYADDANIIITGDTIAEIETKFLELSTKLVDWVSHNELKLNTKKTNYMLFSRSRNLHLGTFVPKIAGIPIERKTVARFLGVIIDDKLSWSHHITAIRSKMSKFIGILYKLKHTLPLKARLLTFNSLVQSHLNYASLVWGSTHKSKIDTLFSAQKKAMRAVMPGWVNYFYKEGCHPTHTKSSFKAFNILTVHNVILKNIMIFLNKINSCLSNIPESVRQTISPQAPSIDNDMLSDHTSDWYTKYNCIPYNTSTFFKGPLLYTHIMAENTNLHTATNPNIFKGRIKQYLLEIQNSGDAEEWEYTNFQLLCLPGIRRSARIFQNTHSTV